MSAKPVKKKEKDKPAAPAGLAFRSIFIVTYGRSGSTLLQGLLNSIPGMLVRGENQNFCHGLFLAWQSLAETHAQQNHEAAMSPTSPWYGAPLLAPDTFLADVYPLVRKQLLADVEPSSVQCLGFKEIRYPEVKELPPYLDFLAALFPKPGFVFLTRDLDSVVKSGWWKNYRPDEAHAKLRGVEKTLGTWAQGRSDVFQIDYAALAGHTPRIKELFDFLGASYDRAAVEQVLATKHSYVSGEGPAKPEAEVATPASPGGWLQVQVMRSAAPVRALFLDPLPDQPAKGRSVNIGGVVLGAESLPDGLTLVLRSGKQARDIEWHLPSPGVGSRFPQDPRAAKARFRLRVAADLPPSEIVLQAPDGKSWVLARLQAAGA